MDNFVNFEVLKAPINWVVVFLILYFLALLSQYVVKNLENAGVSL